MSLAASLTSALRLRTGSWLGAGLLGHGRHVGEAAGDGGKERGRTVELGESLIEQHAHGDHEQHERDQQQQWVLKLIQNPPASVPELIDAYAGSFSR